MLAHSIYEYILTFVQDTRTRIAVVIQLRYDRSFDDDNDV